MLAKTYSAVISKPEDALCTVRAVKSNHLHYSCCQAEMRGVREVSPAPASHHSPGLLRERGSVIRGQSRCGSSHQEYSVMTLSMKHQKYCLNIEIIFTPTCSIIRTMNS